VGNGEVTLSVSLWSADEVKIGQTVQIAANVQADWEGLGALILGVVVVVFFGVGIWRNIRRRRRERAARAVTDAGASAEEIATESQYASADADQPDPSAGAAEHDDRDELEEPRRDG
jgi:flagellar biosynthesis/type III secretory pathway M-ring protein FliF/YscJ